MATTVQLPTNSLTSLSESEVQLLGVPEQVVHSLAQGVQESVDVSKM